MSRVAEMARVEAEAAEAAEAEGEASEPAAPDEQADAPADEPDAAPADEPADEPSSNVSVDKAVAALERENARHAKRVAEIMGADFSLVHVCEACADFAAGFTLTPPDEAPPVLHGEQYEACAKCNGYGLVLTGSRAEHGATQTCQNCTGQGFVTKLPPPPETPAPAAALNPNHSVADQLRAQGYTVLEPYVPAQNVQG